ncbi:hypothetical protein [Pseudomonas atacamensis]|jgi:hypothetical protein|uniref:hypothetical protein n=1 Tax=Pseudomonas atacamensis TaxID=2565368 RepID=UPI003857F24D
MDEFIKLFTCITIPSIISILTIKLGFSLYNSHKQNTTKSHKQLLPFSLDASRGLAEQGYLWLSILAPILYFFFLGHYAWQGYSISVTSEGLSEFLRISTLPIALLSLSIPLSILVARIHATHQTSIQITASQLKNNMDGYYAHRKAMFEYFGGMKDIIYPGKIKGDFHAHPRLHLRFFIDKGPSNGTPEINSEKFKESVEILSEIQSHIHIALTSELPRQENIKHYAHACTKLFSLAGTLNLPCIYEDLKSKERKFDICLNSNDEEADDLKFYGVGTTTHDLVGSYRYVRSFLRVLCEFAGHDVIFFDEKKHLAIDKGNDYTSSPYHFQDISKILHPAIDNSYHQKRARRENSQSKIV